MDGMHLIELIKNFRHGYYEAFPFDDEILLTLEDAVITMLTNGMASDELETISDAIYESEDIVGRDIAAAAKEAIQREFNEIDQMAAETDSISTLEEHKTTLKKLASRAGISSAMLSSAIKTINARISTIDEEAEDAKAPSFSGAVMKDTEKFDDSALMNLFSPLLHR
jgi:hypothetical protein